MHFCASVTVVVSALSSFVSHAYVVPTVNQQQQHGRRTTTTTTQLFMAVEEVTTAAAAAASSSFSSASLLLAPLAALGVGKATLDQKEKLELDVYATEVELDEIKGKLRNSEVAVRRYCRY